MSRPTVRRPRAQTERENEPKPPKQLSTEPDKAPSIFAEPRWSEDEIGRMLDGYINVHVTLWDYVPVGAHVRYFKKGPKRRADRFRPGGFVKSHFINEAEAKFMNIETGLGGNDGDHQYVKYPIAYDDIDELWKKYDKDTFIELHLISTSMAQKKRQIDELTERVAKLEYLLESLVSNLTGDK